MMRKLCFILLCVSLGLIFNEESPAQTSRRAVSAAEINGTFRYSFTGKSKGSSNVIKILALGRGKVKVSFDLIYPFIDGTGQPSANMGQGEGVAEINGDTAVFTTEEFGTCKIIIKFTKPGVIDVTQSDPDFQCGFGHNVNASGTYRKVGNAKPKF